MNELNFKDAKSLLIRNWKIVSGTALLVTAVVLVLNFFVITPQYESTAEIMQRTNRSASSLDTLFGRAQAAGGGGAGLGGLLAGIGGASSELLQFQEIIKSIDTFERVFREDPALLKKILGPKADESNPANVLVGMRRILKFTSIKIDGIALTLRYQNADPQLAKLVVQGILKGLQSFLTENVVTQSQSAEIFVKKRLEELNQTMDRSENKLVRLKVGDRSLVSADHSLQSETIRVERDILRQNQLVSLLSQQYELAQIEAKRDDPMFLTIQSATLPVFPVSPDILLNSVLALILSLVGICAVILFIRPGHRPSTQPYTFRQEGARIPESRVEH